MARHLTDEDVAAVAEAVYGRFSDGCPAFDKKQIGTLRITANTIRVGVIAFITGVGATGAGMILYAMFG